MKILMIDNHDSFTYNLVDQLQQAGSSVITLRRDDLNNCDIKFSDISHVVLSPGPGTPQSMAPCQPLVQRFIGTGIPILGVCLGHQWLAELYGARATVMPRPIHGHASAIWHQQCSLFAELPQPFSAMRYHSWIVEQPLPDTLEALAWCSAEGANQTIPNYHDSGTLLMAFRHKTKPIFGIQFHPESILTPMGQQLINAFCQLESPAKTQTRLTENS